MTECASFSVEAMVRGYHAYKDIWTARGATLPTGESQPSGPVHCGAVLKDEAIVARPRSEEDMIRRDGSVSRGCRYR